MYSGGKEAQANPTEEENWAVGTHASSPGTTAHRHIPAPLCTRWMTIFNLRTRFADGVVADSVQFI